MKVISRIHDEESETVSEGNKSSMNETQKLREEAELNAHNDKIKVTIKKIESNFNEFINDNFKKVENK